VTSITVRNSQICGTDHEEIGVSSTCLHNLYCIKVWHGDWDCGNTVVTAVFTAGMGTIAAVIPRGWDRDCGIPAVMGTKFCQLIHATKSELVKC